jgi:hypothetical protein
VTDKTAASAANHGTCENHPHHTCRCTDEDRQRTRDFRTVINYVWCQENHEEAEAAATRLAATAQKPDPKSSDTGSVLVSLLLAVCIVGGLLGLLALGQAAMCATHTTPGDRPVYCEPTTEGGER